MKEDMAKDGHLWHLGTDRLLLAVQILIIPIIIIITLIVIIYTSAIKTNN